MQFINSNARCLDCGYRLVGLESRNCPECGRWFDPLNSSTFGIGETRRGWRRWAKPPSRAECVTIAALTIIGVVGASGPAQWEAGSVCFIGFFGVPVWFGICCFYIQRAIATICDADRAQHDEAQQRRPLRWLVAPLCALIVASTFAAPWPLLLRFYLSESAFNQAVKDYQAGTVTRNQWVGLFHVEHVMEITPGNGRPATIGFVTGLSFIDPVGFEYDPLPNHTWGYGCVNVAPSWYTFEN